MSQQEIINSALSIVERAKCRTESLSSKENEAFFCSIANLRNLIDLDECNNDTRAKIDALIERLVSYTELGIIKNNEFVSLSPADCYRHGIKEDCFISGKRFLVLSKGRAENYFQELGANLPNDSMFDDELGSIIHASWWYKRRLGEIGNLTQQQLEEYKLEEAKLDYEIYG